MSFSYILAFLFVIPCICLFFSPVPDGNVLLDGAQAAVEFVISVTGSICFWSAVMELAERAGAAGALARVLRRPLRLDVIERTCIIYTNAGILVIPLVRALLGEDYVIYSCAFLVVQQVLLWTHCRSLLCGTRGFAWKKIIGNVNIIAILIGGALFILRLPLPGLVNDLFSQLGAMVGPIGMLLAGIVIADTPLRQLFMRRRHYVPVLLRLIICPIITVLLLRVIGVASWIPDGHSILLTVYLACITPACATVTSMAQLYDRDAEYSSALYVLTTLFSILTMPLMVWVFEVLI